MSVRRRQKAAANNKGERQSCRTAQEIGFAYDRGAGSKRIRVLQVMDNGTLHVAAAECEQLGCDVIRHIAYLHDLSDLRGGGRLQWTE